MASPQDSPTRKKQKNRATRKLLEWRKKQEALKSQTPPAPGSASKSSKTTKSS